jgi:DNA-binding NtrC family response regulator
LRTHTVPVQKVLVAIASRDESASLGRILTGHNWALRFARTFPDALAALRVTSFGVVICAGRFDDGHEWKDLLIEIQQIVNPPQLIVADRAADETVWAEVLNLGCYDLLVTPFEEEEVQRIVHMAWGTWERTIDRGLVRPRPSQREHTLADDRRPGYGRGLTDGGLPNWQPGGIQNWQEQ